MAGRCLLRTGAGWSVGARAQRRAARTDPPSGLPPTAPRRRATAFVDALLAQPGSVAFRPGSGHWRIFRGMSATLRLTGNRIPDAYHAALAIEHGGYILLQSGIQWIRATSQTHQRTGRRRAPVDGQRLGPAGKCNMGLDLWRSADRPMNILGGRGPQWRAGSSVGEG